MHESFVKYADSLVPSIEKLITMSPVKIGSLPPEAPSEAIYLFSEGNCHLYVGRTRRLRQRLRQHSTPSAPHNQAVFAFKLARQITGRTRASYIRAGSRVELESNPEFADAFSKAKDRVRKMYLRFVEESDPLRQALLEIYVHIVLNTQYNDFDTH